MDESVIWYLAYVDIDNPVNEFETYCFIRNTLYLEYGEIPLFFIKSSINYYYDLLILYFVEYANHISNINLMQTQND